MEAPVWVVPKTESSGVAWMVEETKESDGVEEICKDTPVEEVAIVGTVVVFTSSVSAFISSLSGIKSGSSLCLS